MIQATPTQEAPRDSKVYRAALGRSASQHYRRLHPEGRKAPRVAKQATGQQAAVQPAAPPQHAGGDASPPTAQEADELAQAQALPLGSQPGSQPTPPGADASPNQPHAAAVVEPAAPSVRRISTGWVLEQAGVPCSPLQSSVDATSPPGRPCGTAGGCWSNLPPPCSPLQSSVDATSPPGRPCGTAGRRLCGRLCGIATPPRSLRSTLWD